MNSPEAATAEVGSSDADSTPTGPRSVVGDEGDDGD
jgi:hypothetical protein